MLALELEIHQQLSGHYKRT